MERPIIGLTEKVRIHGRKVAAKVDTGASRCSIDLNLAAQLQLGPIIGIKDYRNAHGKTTRPVIKAKLELEGKKFNALFNVVDRKNLKYKVLIGESIIRRGKFIIDPMKK